jgi:hypothetical protein
MDAFKKIGYKQLIQLGLMDFWITKQQNIVKNLPEETKQFIKEIEAKSDKYIDVIFPQSANARKPKF